MILSGALKWSFLSEIASKSVQPIIFIVLAKILVPDDFGVMTAALMVISFSQIFWEAGMGQALIQRQTKVNIAANIALLVNLVLGFIMATILFFSAEKIASVFFQDSRVTTVIQVMTIQIIFGAASSVHNALLQKEMGFKKLFWVRFLTTFIPGLASIPLAIIGAGYWALVVGSLVGQFAQFVLLWRISKWRPSFTFESAVAREICQFGGWVGITGLLGWFYMWVDALIVGMFMGSHELGLYRTGNQLVIMIYAIIFGPITAVLYSYLSQMAENRDRMTTIATKVIKTLIITAVPMGIFIYSTSDLIADFVFGKDWKGISLIIGVMALMHGFSWVVGFNGEFYRAIGKPKYETVVTGLTLSIYLPAYLYSIQQSFEVFIWTRLGLAIVAMLLHIWLVHKVLSISFVSISRYLLFITIATFIILYFVNMAISEFLYGHIEIIMTVIFSSLIFLLFIYLREKNGLLKELLPYIRGLVNADKKM